MKGNPNVTDRIAQHLPDAKIILIARHPIERIESHYVQLIENGEVVQTGDNKKDLKKAIRNVHKLLASSLYWDMVQDLRRHYKEENILVLFFDDLKKDPKSVLNQCCEFLGATPNVEVNNVNRVLNTREEKSTDGAILRKLREYKVFTDIKWMMPKPLVQAIKPLFKEKIGKVDIEWDESLKKEVFEKVSNDCKIFLKAYNKPEDYWSF